MAGGYFGGREWTVLQTEQVHVQCRDEASGTVCQAMASFAATPDDVCGVLEDPNEWPDVFATVQRTQKIADGVWLIEVDLPWPLGVWTMTAAIEHSVDEEGHHTRLLHSESGKGLWQEASWDLTPEAGGSHVVYTWTPPQWRAMPESWRQTILRRTGHNTVWGVALAAGTEPRQ